MILVTGASGHVGGELVRRLAAEQRPVRALLRTASDASTMPDGVEPAEGDLNRPESLGKNRPEHFGLSHELSGPAALRPADRLAALADALHRPLRFQAQPDDEARGEMLSTIPARYVEAFFRFFADGEFDDTPVRTTVTEITGRPARTFTDWVEAHIDVFRCG